MERRNRLDIMTPSEKAILNAIDEVEKVGAHPMLTDVILKLQDAKGKLSDYIDADAKFFAIDPPKCPIGQYWNGTACVDNVG